MTDEHAPLERRLDSMSRWNDVSAVVKACKQALADERDLAINVKDVKSVWPNAAVPIAAIIQHFKSVGLGVSVQNETAYLKSVSLRNPIQATPENLRSRRVVNTVWAYFDDQEAFDLTTALISTLSKTVEL